MNIGLSLIGCLILLCHRKNNVVVYTGGALGLMAGIILYFSVKNYNQSVIGISIDIGIIIGALLALVFKPKITDQKIEGLTTKR